MINKYTDPIITNYRFDKVGSRASVPITESLTVNNGFLFLKEIPDRNNVVTIGNLVEVQKPEELDSETKFYIDYNAGIVYFDSKLNGTKVNVEYSGIGIVYYPASRIYLEVDENHEIIRTLSDIEGQLSSLINLKNQQERLKQEIEERNGNLNKTIEEARKIDLSGSVDKANQAKTDLESTTRKANIADANLRTDIEFAKGVKIDLKKQEEQSKTEVQKSVDLANTTKTSLDGSITAANEKINKANEKVSEISSKISEANETQQKLTDTKNDITSSLSDYDKKSAEIKQSAGDIESKNSELKSTISRADESNTTLNSTIEKSKDSNTALSRTVEESKTKNTELSSSIATATNLKGQLETKNKEASGNIDSLNSKISEGTQLKSDLDTSTTNANQANAELKDTTNKANLSKTQLDESKASADELNKNLLSNKDELTTIDNSLKSENEKATKNISDLDTKSASGKQVIDGLNSVTLKSETAKTNLDDSNTKATQTNAELKATTQTANDTKTSLEQIKNESSTLSNELSEGNTTASSNIESLKSENQSAKTNITGLQTENQNALSKQETLSSETAKANEAIAKIAELITSSTDLKNKLEQIVASGDLDKYITDPKLREILTAYATKDDLSKIDVTSQLIDYAKKTEIPTSLSQLKDDETHRLVTDAEKEKWNNPPNPDLTDYAKKTDLDTKIDKADIVHSCMGANEEDKVLSQRGGYELMEWTNQVVMSNINFLSRQVPTTLSQLTNDTNFKTETEIQEMIANSSKLKKEVTTSLPSTGKDDVIYLVKDTKGKDNNNYLEYLWINGKWELIGSTQVDLSGYAKKEEILDKIYDLINNSYFVQPKVFPFLDFLKNPSNVDGDWNTTPFSNGVRFYHSKGAKNSPNGDGVYIVFTSFEVIREDEVDWFTWTSSENFIPLTVAYHLESGNIYMRNFTIDKEPEDVSFEPGTLECGVVPTSCTPWKEITKDFATKNDITKALTNTAKLQDLDLKLNKSDLSPFTQQELEEAFK